MKKGTVQILSFVSGLTLAAVVVGVTLSKNKALCNEIENQVTSVLKTTRSMVEVYKSIATKSKKAAALVKNDPSNKTVLQEAAEKTVDQQVVSQWDAIESQISR